MTEEQVNATLRSIMEKVSHGFYDEAEKLAEECLAIVVNLPEDSRHANIYEMLGNVAWHRTDYTKALELYKKALAISLQCNYAVGIANGNSKLGMVYSSTGDFTKGLEYLSIAIQFYEENHNLDALAGATCNIANIYAKLDQIEKSLEYFERALQYATDGNHEQFRSIITANIGASHVVLGNYLIGIEYFLKSLSIRKKLGDKNGISGLYKNLGAVYCDYLKEYDVALEYMLKALRIAEELGSKGLIADIKYNIGSLYMNEGFSGYDLGFAEKNMCEAIVLLEDIGANHQLALTHNGISTLYKSCALFEKALHHVEVARELEKVIASSEVKKYAAQLDSERKNAEREKQLALAQKEKAILNNILPEGITQRLIKGENPIADHFDSVSALFMDIVDFTKLSTKISAQQLVHLLNAIFKAADAVMREFGLEKIKTIGDAYMAVAGAPIVQEDHAHRAANAALKLLEVMENLEVSFPPEYGDRSWIENIPEIEVRIGLHCGPAAAGVVGENKFLYDLWGDAVNTASRMESHGAAGKIHVSEEFKYAVETVHAPSLRFIPRGEIEIKGKGKMRTFFLEKVSAP